MTESNPQTKPNTRRDKAMAARRRKILEAAVRCFLANGYHQTGVRDIAKCAGISLGNLYNHFPSKHDVLVEIALLEHDELKPFLNLLSEPAPAVKVLDKFISSYAKYLSAPENVILSIEIASEAIRKPDIAKMFLDNRADLIIALAALLKRGGETNDFRHLSRPRETARMLIGLIEDSAFHCVLSDVPVRKVHTGLRDFLIAAVEAR